MTSGVYTEPGAAVPKDNFYNEVLTYDLGGNISRLQRTGGGIGSTAKEIDDLAYVYQTNSNRLQTVTDAKANLSGYPTGGGLFDYDLNGNMTVQADKGISNIAYNILDLPSTVTQTSGIVQYLYRADGSKLKKVYQNKTTDYVDGFQYEDGTLKFVPTSEGYFNFENNTYIYHYSDHLGNIRLSFTKNGSGAAVIEESNFYPYGMKQENNVQSNPAYNYEHSGKEFQKETGWSDFGARMYMADIGRWGVIDPLAETTTRVSPYNYALNNPVMFVDPDGRKAYKPDVVEGIENLGVIANMSRRYTRITNGGDIEDGVWSSDSSEGGGGSSLGGINSLTIAYMVAHSASQGQTMWTNTGYGFSNGSNAVDYAGNDMTGVELPEVVIKAVKGNAGLNRHLMDNGIDLARMSWNMSQSSARYREMIANCATCRDIEDLEYFLFIDVPLSFTGEGLLGAGWKASGASNLIGNAYARFAPKIVAKVANFTDDAIRLTTSSKSLAPSRTYTIFDGTGQLYKFGVSDANLVRYAQSLKQAGPGAFGKFSDIMPKNKAHIAEKYLRSLHYNSTGQYSLPGMKIPYPVNFNTGLPIKP